jgi:short subunit dehydrogenase-like uncharacterized protein
MRVLVLGGSGFLGSRVVRALRRVEGAEVLIGSRRAQGAGTVRVDLRMWESLPALRGFDVIVNCADSTRVPPDQVIGFCMEEGLTVLETTSESPVIHRLYEDYHLRARGRASHLRGTLVLGVGLFPGLSNLLAIALKRSIPECERLELGVRLNPKSGAGAGMLNVMTRMMGSAALRYERGRVAMDPPLRRGIEMPFPGGRHSTILVGLPEAGMLHWSAGVPSTATYLATDPPLPRPVMAMAQMLLARKGALRNATRGLMRAQLGLVRGRLLRDRPTPVEITALANRGAVAPGSEPSLSLTVNDGALAAAYAIAASVQLLARRAGRAPGCLFPDEAFELDEVTAAMTALAGPELALRAPAPAGA